MKNKWGCYCEVDDNGTVQADCKQCEKDKQNGIIPWKDWICTAEAYSF